LTDFISSNIDGAIRNEARSYASIYLPAKQRKKPWRRIFRINAVTTACHKEAAEKRLTAGEKVQSEVNIEVVILQQITTSPLFAFQPIYFLRIF